MTKTSIDGSTLKVLLAAGVEGVSRNVQRINAMNVYPVPDGDTGINMYHTLKRAWKEIESLESSNFSLVFERFAYGSMMGARGNSGTILSQLLKGFADGLDGAQSLTSILLVSGWECAVERAYAAVSQPTEGTILTVARKAGESLQGFANEDMSLDDMLDSLVAAAQASLNNTPSLLPVLRDAGVVDAGGMGLLCFLRGMQRPSDADAEFRSEIIGDMVKPQKLALLGESYGYDVQFLMRGDGLDVDAVRRDLEDLGWSLLVVGDDDTIKVHIHAHNPAVPLDYAFKSGAMLDDIVVENMQLQAQAFLREQGGAPSMSAETVSSDVAVIAVADGDGMGDVFRELNCARIISGGPGMNPKTEDFISSVNSLPSDRLIILPNNRNIIMAARQATEFVSDKQVKVLPTQTVLQGISAMLAYGDAIDNSNDFESTAAKMCEALGEVTSIEITRAIRSTELEGLVILEHDYLGIIDGKICVASADLSTTLLDTMQQATDDAKELATFYYGAGFTAVDAAQLVEQLTKHMNNLDYEIVHGGQTLYPILISVE